MFTHRYKGHYIHGYCDCNECRVQTLDGKTIGYYKSYRAAQVAITKHLNKAAY